MYFSYYPNAPINSVADLFSNEDQGFEDLLATAAENFPPDLKAEYRNSSPMSASSPFCSSSGSESSSMHSPDTDHPGEVNDHHFESDSDVEQLDLDDQPIHPRELLRRASSVPSDDKHIRHVNATTTHKAKPSGLTRHSRSGHITPHRYNPYPPPSSPVSRRKPVRRLSNFTSNGSDYEPGDESEANATDDEYVPSPQLAPLKHRRASPASSTSSKRSTAASLPASTASQPATSHLASNPDRKPRRAPSSRNQQSRSWDIQELVANADKSNFICPVCNWVQRNRRVPDLKRHLKTHVRPASDDQTKGFWCKGVPLEDAAMYGIRPTAESFLFLGEWRVGGCQKSFSRADALKRHLDNGNISCIPSRMTDD